MDVDPAVLTALTATIASNTNMIQMIKDHVFLDCGDSYINTTINEECDNGLNNSDTSACTTMCKNAVCGDGFVYAAAGEVCDDGNTDDGDACSANCSQIVDTSCPCLATWETNQPETELSEGFSYSNYIATSVGGGPLSLTLGLTSQGYIPTNFVGCAGPGQGLPDPVMNFTQYMTYSESSGLYANATSVGYLDNGDGTISCQIDQQEFGDNGLEDDLGLDITIPVYNISEVVSASPLQIMSCNNEIFNLFVNDQVCPFSFTF